MSEPKITCLHDGSRDCPDCSPVLEAKRLFEDWLATTGLVTESVSVVELCKRAWLTAFAQGVQVEAQERGVAYQECITTLRQVLLLQIPMAEDIEGYTPRYCHWLATMEKCRRVLVASIRTTPLRTGETPR